MKFEELEEPIQDIITLVEKFDEKYRKKCFEILLEFYLRKIFQLATAPEVIEKESEAKKEEFLIPIDVRAFLQRNNIPQEKLQELFLMQKDEIRPTYKITATKKATAQIQIALLTALENAMHGSGRKFEFSMEPVRERCKNYRVYDKTNFRKHFKNNKRLFKSIDDPEHIELSPEGETELAEVILTVAAK